MFLSNEEPVNRSIDTDPQLQEAAPPHVLWSGHLQRSIARGRLPAIRL